MANDGEESHSLQTNYVQKDNHTVKKKKKKKKKKTNTYERHEKKKFLSLTREEEGVSSWCNG